MADTGEGSALPITITEGGVTVSVLPLGWLDLAEIPDAFEAIWTIDTSTRAGEDALREAMIAFGHRIDQYAAGPVPPSRIPLRSMRSFLRRWASEVRDAAVDPPSAGSSPSRASKPSRAARPRSPRS